MRSYARRDLLRNPRRTLASLVGVVLGVGLFSAVLFFVDGSGASMTKRAIAPVAIDLQRVLTSPLGEGVRLQQRLGATGPLHRGERTRVRLTVRNLGAAPAHEVLVKDRLPAALAYVARSARRGGRRLADPGGESPFAHGPGHVGLTVGTVAPGTTVRLDYAVRATRRLPGAAVRPSATISTRERPVPERANRPDLVPLDRLRDRVAALPGIAAADQLAFADLPPSSLQAGTATLDRPIKVFGFERAYAERYPAIRVAAGGFARDGALLSPAAARGLGVRPGDHMRLHVPGARRPARLAVSGIVDLSRARALFNSREGLKLEDFLYLPDAIVISPGAFRRLVVPAFREALAARGTALAVKSPPTLEIDVRLDRAPLAADPGRALRQTRAVAARVRRVAPGQDFMLDNLSNTLAVAEQDAAVAKRMFLFLGLPGLLLAAFLAAYSGSVLAASQRREHANLRLRGAGPRQLRSLVAYRTAILAGAGALLGTAAGFATVLAILGPSALFEAATGRLAVSAALALGASLVAAGLAMFVPGWLALRRDVSGERRELALERRPTARRLALELAALVVALAATLFAIRRGAFDAASGQVSTGRATALASHTLLLPLGVWVAGTLLAARLLQRAAGRLPVTPPPRFGPVVRGLLARTLSRRSRALATGIVGVGLVIAFGTGLAVFAATYDAAKAADARFTNGSSLRVTPSPASATPHPAAYARALEVPGVAAATPVIAGRENAVARSAFNSDVADLAAIDPRGFARTAALSDEDFPHTTAAAALRALHADPTAALLDADTADALRLKVGDRAEVLLARGTRHQQLRTLRVAGVFDRFPGFPEGLDVVVDLGTFRHATGITETDFFLARAGDPSAAGLGAATAALQAGPGSTDRLHVDTTQTTFNKEQSSLTALNVRGLVDVDSVYTLAMTAAVIGIFIFALMLQRRREYVVLRAQGLPTRELLALIAGEATVVAAGGLLAGMVVGGALGALLVKVLKPLFILSPVTVLPFADAARLATLLALATVTCALAALGLLRRLRPSEVLRET